MEIKQFEDINLAHFSYAILSHDEIVLIDPARDPAPYYAFAKQHNATIKAVIETHPHADFISSHLEIHKSTDATIYVSSLLGATYPYQSFDNGDVLQIGDVYLKAHNTPGHSPDSISVILEDQQGKKLAVFSGDTLFIGDCGRPDLREKAGAITASRRDLAKQMYYSLRNTYLNLPDDVIVYPAHGAGSLCGKGLSKANHSTIGAEKISNWSLQEMSEEEFIEALLADQPFVPKYFPNSVSINKEGAPNFQESIDAVPFLAPVCNQEDAASLNSSLVIIDTRSQEAFKAGHLPKAINLMIDTKFETWLGSIIAPGEKFYLTGSNEEQLKTLVARIAKIGYENQIEGVFVSDYGYIQSPSFSVEEFKANVDAYTIVDIRNPSEVNAGKIFASAVTIPLYELRERAGEIPTHKPIMVHCAAGYRSAAGSSILENVLSSNATIFDLSIAIKDFKS